MTALDCSPVVEQIDEATILFAGLRSRERDQQPEPWCDRDPHHSATLGCGDDGSGREMARREAFGCLVPKAYVECTSDNPAEAEIGAAETPTRFVFGRPDRPWLWGRDARHERREVRSSLCCEGLEDAAEAAGVAVPRRPAEVRPAFGCEFDLANAEIDEVGFRCDASEDAGDGAETGGLCDLSAAAADCAS